MNFSGQKRGGTQRDEEYIITIDIADEETPAKVPQNEPATTPQQGLDSGKSPSAPSEIMLNETMTLVKNESAQNVQDTCIRRDKNRMLLETARNEIATLTMQVAQSDIRVAVILSEKTELHLEVRRLQHELEGRDEKIEDLQQENLKLTLELCQMNEAYKKCLEEKALKIEEKVDRTPVNTDASSQQIKQGDKDNTTGPASQGKLEDVKQTRVAEGDVEMPSDDEDDGDLQIVEQGEAAMVQLAPGSYQCRLRPRFRCKIDTFLTLAEMFKNNIDKQLRFKRNQKGTGLIVFNNNPGGIMIEEKAWYRHLGDRSGSSCTQFRELMLAMLKKKALYFVSLDGLSFRVGNKIIYLPAVHTELKKAVYSLLGVAETNFYVHSSFKSHLSRLKKKVCIEDFQPKF